VPYPGFALAPSYYDEQLQHNEGWRHAFRAQRLWCWGFAE
jgi:hypothetical protein